MPLVTAFIFALQIVSTGQPFLPNNWYEVDLIGLGIGSLGFLLSVDNEMVPYRSDDFVGIDFNIFNGPLYIGGHPSLSTIQVSWLLCSL